MTSAARPVAAAADLALQRIEQPELPSLEHRDEQHAGDESSDVRAERDATAALRRHDVAQELQREPQPEHETRGQMHHPREETEGHEDEHSRMWEQQQVR